MSDNLMETSPGGGGAPPYETQQTVTQPKPKQGGQMGQTETAEPTGKPPSQTTAADKEAKSEQNVENIRYGQTISEGGMGGMTTVGGGSGQQDHALGEAERTSAENKNEEGMHIGG